MRPLRLAALVLVCMLVVAGCVPATTLPPPSSTSAPPTAVPPAPALPTPTPDLIAPVKAWADAINKGDVDAALALITEDATWLGCYSCGEGTTGTGKEQVRPGFDDLVGQETKLQVKECQPQGDRVACSLSVVNGCIAAFGAPDGLPAKLVFIYQPDGKIREASFALDDPRKGDFQGFWNLSEAWALENRAEEYARMKLPSREGASLEVKFCKEYAASLK
jgi:ketosteroid isomerase-like protein